MKVLILYDYPLSSGGLATQGDLLYKGLLELGLNAHAVHFESAQEKDLKMASDLGIEKSVTYATNTISRHFMPYLMAACDIYAAPSRLEGFGMPQVEADACQKPVIGIKAMGMLDTLI